MNIPNGLDSKSGKPYLYRNQKDKTSSKLLKDNEVVMREKYLFKPWCILINWQVNFGHLRMTVRALFREHDVG